MNVLRDPILERGVDLLVFVRGGEDELCVNDPACLLPCVSFPGIPALPNPPRLVPGLVLGSVLGGEDLDRVE